MFRRFGLIAVFCTLAQVAGLQPALALTITVGVRVDAPPFSFQSDQNPAGQESNAVRGPLHDGGFRGYMVQICDQALLELLKTHSDLIIETRVVDAQSRLPETEAEKVDILCDPTSVTDDRLDGWAASLPVYLSGIVVASVEPFPRDDRCGALVGIVSRTTAPKGLGNVIESGSFGRFTERIRASFATGETPSADCEAAEAGAIVARATHAELAAEFCRGDLIFYVGDLEIVRRNLEIATQQFPDCRFSLSSATYSDERYTILTKRSDPDLNKAALLLEFHATLAQQALSTDSSLVRAYRAYFFDRAPSEKLQALLWAATGQLP
jgi:hypothetical protein